MTWPICGSQVNVPDPAADDEDDEAAEDEDEELAGTATLQVPASPSVAFSWVWLVSDCRVTVAVPVAYPLLALAGRPDPRNAPVASAAPRPAAATTTTTPATTQPRRPGWSRSGGRCAAVAVAAGPADCPAGPAARCSRASVFWFISSSFWTRSLTARHPAAGTSRRSWPPHGTAATECRSRPAAPAACCIAASGPARPGSRARACTAPP